MVILFGAISLSGCFAKRSVNLDQEAGLNKTFVYKFWLLGIDEVTFKVNCKSGVNQIVEGSTFSDLMLECVTLGILSPRTHKVSCNEEK